MKKTSVAFYTFGCRLNQSETAVVRQAFEADGFPIVGFKKPADVVVINTCTVTENGDADTRRLINGINRIHPNTRIALIGCQAQIQKEKLTALPNVRWVIGNARKMDFLSIFRDNETPETPQVITPAIPRDPFTISTAGIDRAHTRANIKIQDGCDFFCSFCEIPYARGRARSRTFSDIQREARSLVAAGHKELVLTGINVGTYKNSKKTITDIVDSLEQIRGLERIRISSIEPTTIPSQLIKKMAGLTKLCRHLHIPLQSGNNQVLKGMKRKYSVEQFSDFIQTVFAAVPQICIGTDVIAGFPGETEGQFNETVQNLRKWPVHYFHVFRYSQRSLAKSQNLIKKIPSPIITERSQKLRELSKRKRALYYRSLIGTKQKVLFEQFKDGHWRGLTDNYARVEIKSNRPLSNTFLEVLLTKQNGQMLLGTTNAYNG